ncbi:hypothetical protein DVA86_03770 [Streptomyces armeniacus]|uniref:Uncharacterized protein n=1 Tax=Streptomyces armeniacus TaxID=83291 RepID=A0A345XJS8_9ACTN|nr:hypothetical protein [Streptomyces armeniacus]AXK31894.1 hypothetical protein DVA86_03770 [Streptomyces armeniacus]
MGSAVRYWAERIVLIFMATAGILVLVVDLFGWLDELAPGVTLQKMTLLILSTVTLFLLLELDRLRMLDNVDTQLSKLDIDKEAGRLRREHYAGVVRVHPRFPEDVFTEFVRDGASREVTVLQTWIPDLQRLRPELRDAIADRRTEVRILLLHPASPVAQLRGDALRTVRDPAQDEDVKANVERCLSHLEALYHDIPVHRSLLQVRVYNSLPSIAVYKAGEHYLVSSFLHGQLAVDSTQIELDGCDSVMGREVQQELDTLWMVGRDVDLSDWRASISTINL